MKCFGETSFTYCGTKVFENWSKTLTVNVNTSLCLLQPLQRIENDVELLGEHLSLGAGLHYPPATHPALTPHSTQFHFLSHDPLPQEFFGVVSNKKDS